MTGHRGLRWWQACGVLSAALVASAAQAAAPEWTHCFEQHASRFALDAGLLRAVATVESNLQPRALGRNTNGSRDLGLMQINTTWLPTLARFGIRETDLLEPCTNIEVGAWILAGLIQRHGDSWEAVGAYNAGCSVLTGQACRQARARYAWKVQRALASLANRPAASVAPSAPIPTLAALELATDTEWSKATVLPSQSIAAADPVPRPGMLKVAVADMVSTRP